MKQVTRKKIEAIAAEVRRANSIVITAHVNPDGDAIGSELALYLTLRKLGKQVWVMNTDPLPEIYYFLPAAREVKQVEDFCPVCDLLFVLDCGSAERMGGNQMGHCPRVVNIDHHLEGHTFGDINWVEDKASSTAEMVAELIDGLGVEWDVEIATNIYVGVLTDTGGFRYSNTTPVALALAGRMVSYGVQPEKIARALYERQPLSALKLLARALDSLEVSEDGLVASMTITRRMVAECGVHGWEAENFVNYPRSLDGVEIAILYQEIDDKQVKVSLRSKGTVNVARIAKAFSGGGHFHAAGCRLSGDLLTVKRQVERLVHQMLYVRDEPISRR